MDYISKLDAVFDISEATAEDVANRIPIWVRKYNITPEEISNLIGLDPTRGKYSEWLINNYKKGLIKTTDDDFPLLAAGPTEITAALKFFDKKKSKLETRDLNDYTPDGLLEVVKKGASLTKSERKAARRGGLEVPDGAEHVLSHGIYDVVKIIGSEAAKNLSSGTKWCTANDPQAKKYLAEGPLYLVYVNGTRSYLVHYPRGEFKNVEDKEVPNPRTKAYGGVDVKGELINLLEPITGIKPHQVISYASETLRANDRTLPGAEEHVLKTASASLNGLKEAVGYAIVRSSYGIQSEPRWPELEQVMLDWASQIRPTLKPYNPEAVPSSSTPEIALASCLVNYCLYAANQAWPEVEDIIISYSLYAAFYAKLRARLVGYDPGDTDIRPWPELETKILQMRDATAASYYAREALERRWPEAEPFIYNSSSWRGYAGHFSTSEAERDR